MKKIINFRPIFYCFISLGLGIYFARQIFCANLFILIAISLAFAFLTFVCIKYKCITRLLMVASAFVLGVGIFALSIATFNNVKLEAGNYLVSGRINTVTTYSSSQSVLLDNAYIGGKKCGNMIVSVMGSSIMEEGYVITFTSYVEKTELFSFNKFNNYYYKYNVAYTSQVYSNQVSMDDFSGLTISESLRKSVKLILDKNMEPNEAGISYASLFGDKTYVNNDIRDNFSISGIAHLLAVSGLHIGFLTSMLMFLLNKTKLKKYVNVIIIGVILAFYCYLCSFSVSVLRASIMFLVLSIAGIFGKQYDRLNSIGLAGIFVLLYKPLSFFDAGFLLSFGCVLGIFMFTNFFKRLFSKWHCPKKLADTFSVMFAVQLGILPLTIYYYGELSLLTMVANFICIPIFEVFFILLFALCIIALICPPLGVILKVPSLIIAFIIKVAQIIADQKWAIINLTKVSPFMLVGIYFVLFVCSQFINLNKRQKLTTGTILLAVTILISLGITMPITFSQNVTFISAYNDNCYIVQLNNKSFCVGEYNSYLNDSSSDYFNNVVYNTADYLLLQNSYTPPKDNIYDKIYSFGSFEADNVLLYNKEYVFDNVKIIPIKISSKVCGVMLEYNNFKVFVGDNALTFENFYSINISYGKINLLISSNNNITNVEELNVDSLYYNKQLITQDQTVNMSGSWTINYKNDKMQSIRSLN